MFNPNAISFADATAVKVVDSHTYEVNLQNDWAIGTGESVKPRNGNCNRN